MVEDANGPDGQKKNIDDRLNALTMNLELLSHSVEDLRKSALADRESMRTQAESIQALRISVEAQADSIRTLSTSAEAILVATDALLKTSNRHERRITRLEKLAG